MNPFPASILQRMTGEEQFFSEEKFLPVTLLDFWRWSASDLLGNTQRGILAEFLVASALELTMSVREEWAAFDLQSQKGTTIEVKSAAYLQSWSQKTVSTISFSIAPTNTWDRETGRYANNKKRHADVYCFCLLNHKEKSSVNPLNLGQWKFFLLPAKVLDEKHPDQKTISLSSLMKLNPVNATYTTLNAAFKELENGLQTEK